MLNLSQKIINYLKSKDAWFEDNDIDCNDYRNILKSLGLDINSEFGEFYTHAEENPGGFNSKRNFELWQICWVYENNDYISINENLKNELYLNDDYYVISEFEGESCYFYNKSKNSVELIGYTRNGISILKKWDSFNEFLEWYFDL